MFSLLYHYLRRRRRGKKERGKGTGEKEVVKWGGKGKWRVMVVVDIYFLIVDQPYDLIY